MTPEEAEAIVALLNAQLEHGSDQDKAARRITAQILRAAVSHVLHTAPDIDASVLDMLADLVDPDCPRECRGYIRFEQRREGRPSDTLREIIFATVGDPVGTRLLLRLKSRRRLPATFVSSLY